MDISEDGFLSLMADNGDTKDDVKIPEGDVGEKIEKLFRVEEKDTSKLSDRGSRNRSADRCRCHRSDFYGRRGRHRGEGGSSLLNVVFACIFHSESRANSSEPCPPLRAGPSVLVGTNCDVFHRQEGSSMEMR